MSTSSRSVSSESANVPSGVASPSSQLMSSEKASDRVPVQVFEGHERWVSCVCFYPDESKLVSGSDDGTLRIWDRKTGAVEVLKGHTSMVTDVDVSRDGKLVISGGSDETVHIWDGESGETMHVFEGHRDIVMSVGFSRDSTRVVSGSYDGTVRVWSVETGELAFEPIECHGRVYCARHSPSGDRIASGGESVQIWNAETGSGILSIRDSSVSSLVWTADGTHLIGGDWQSNITIWNSHNGERLRTWKAYDNLASIIKLSLSPTGTQLATSNWDEKLAFVWDISTGEQVAVFKHSRDGQGIAYSPSGKFIATACNDDKVYVWEVPMFEDPQTKAKKSRPPSFSWFLDQPAIPLAGPSRNNGMGVDGLGHSLPNHDQQASPPPRRIFNKVKSTFTNLFTHRSTGVTQTSPVRETIEPVEVAAERDKVFWIVIERTVWTPLNTFIFMVFYCRKPGPEERRGFHPINQGTNAKSPHAATGNAATTNQPERPETVHGTGNVGAAPNASPTQAGDSVIRTQPERTAAMSLSGIDNQGVGPGSPLSPPETIEMVTRGWSSITSTISHNSAVPAHVSIGPQPTPSKNPAPSKASSSYTAMIPAPLSVSSNIVSPPSAQSSSHNADVAVTVSPEELAMLQEFRRHKVTTDPLIGVAHDREPSIDSHLSTTPSERRGSATPNPSVIHPPSNPQRGSHPHPQSSQSLVGLDPLLNVVPSLRSPSLFPSRHLLTPTITSNVQSMHAMVSAHDLLAEASLESTAQLGIRRPANDEDVD